MNFKSSFWLLLGISLLATGSGLSAETNSVLRSAERKVYIVPIREGIKPPLVYVVRRGVKEAMEANADALILDMNTDGGRIDVTEEIIQIISKFKGPTVTYVNDRAFSAGAFIAVATEKIYMAPQSVIGAAAPIMMTPGGGVDKMPDTVEAKMTSAVRALVRVQAEKNGHNIEVVEAMIDKTKALEIDGEVLNKEGNILTLTDTQARKEYGEPSKPLLSLGTVESIDALLTQLGYENFARVTIEPTGAEKLGIWINRIGPLLLVIGIIGLYVEFKTPGFGVPGVVGIAAFAIYFLGGYVAGFSGGIWFLIFITGLILLLLEFFILPGTFFIGLTGAALMLIALVMGMVDIYPGKPTIPALPDLRLPVRNLAIATGASFVIALILARFLPKTTVFQKLVSQSASGVDSIAELQSRQAARIGKIGVAISPLSPGGRAQFDDQLLDVITRGERVEKGQTVRIIGHSGLNEIVEAVK